MTTYKDCVEWLFRQLPMFQRQGSIAYKKDLERTRKWCSVLGNPQENQNFIHIAGTNGKGSTCHMLASVLQEAGYKVGLLTSPHLVDFRERIRINGNVIDEAFVLRFVQNHQHEIQNLAASFFEITTGMAFAYFKDQKVDIAIIETGLGGELDSTNIITPIACGITNIGWDHMHILGDTLAKIAEAKAGIIKPNTPTVLGGIDKNLVPIFREKAEQVGAPLYFAAPTFEFTVDLDLKGFYQNENARLAQKILEVIQDAFLTTQKQQQAGFSRVIPNTGLQGRWQQLSIKPIIVTDTAHNSSGLERIREQISRTEYDRLHVVLGFVQEKDSKELVTYFPEDALFYFSEPNVPRKKDIEQIKKELGFAPNYNYFPNIAAALSEARKHATVNDFIYVGGSTFVVAEVLQEQRQLGIGNML